MTDKSGIPLVLKWNRQYVSQYLDASVVSERELYLKLHPTVVLVFKCMDGRLKFYGITRKPPGVAKPMRNIGGRFDVGWPALELYLSRFRDEVINGGNHGLIIATYHYSRSANHLGCRGFNYDVEQARAYISNMRNQLERVFGSTVFSCVMMGIETDMDCLILHGEEGDTIDVSQYLDSSEIEIAGLVAQLYPRMRPRIQADLVPLITGNIEHVRQIKASGRLSGQSPDHQEWIIGLGRGFEYMHTNSCLIVGPHDPNLDEPVATAGELVLTNLETGRIQGKRPLLLVSAPYSGSYRPFAVEKALYLRDFGQKVLRTRIPKLYDEWGMEVLCGVVNTDNGGELQILE